MVKSSPQEDDKLSASSSQKSLHQEGGETRTPPFHQNLQWRDVFQKLGSIDEKQEFILLPKQLFCGNLYAYNARTKKAGTITLALPTNILGADLRDLDKWSMVLPVWMQKKAN